MKEIKLKKGGIALVDDEDFEALNQYEWYAIKTQKNTYAVRCIYNKETGQVRHLRMHRIIMSATERWDLIDHIDHNPLNNQKYNLRRVTQRQNLLNSKRFNKTGYKGVTYRKDNSKFTATIHAEGRDISLGCYTTAVEAAKAYDRAALNYFKEYACINTYN